MKDTDSVAPDAFHNPPSDGGQRRRVVGPTLAQVVIGRQLSVRASGVTTCADRCIARLGIVSQTCFGAECGRGGER